MSKEKLIEEFIEKGADLEHERWSGWQSYFFGKCQVKPQSQVDGMDDRYVYLALPKDLYERWGRQMNTPYSELSEQEKESDRKEVRQYLPLVESLLTSHTEELKKVIEGKKQKMVLVQESDEDYQRNGNRELTRGWNHIRTGYNQALDDIISELNHQ